MILRRIASALKRQDWAVVLVEFALVILGVLIALQVNNWNEARKERNLESAYLENLHTETMLALPALRGLLAEKEGHLAALAEVIALIDAGDGEAGLTPAQCLAVFESHIYDISSLDLPTVRELFTTGRISLLSNPGLRAAILEFQQSFSARESRRTNLLGGRIISRSYPRVIKLNPKIFLPPEDDVSIAPTCRLDLMIGDEALRNDLIDNGARLYANTNLLVRNELTQLEAIHAYLDGEFGIDHELTD